MLNDKVKENKNQKQQSVQSGSKITAECLKILTQNDVRGKESIGNQNMFHNLFIEGTKSFFCV